MKVYRFDEDMNINMKQFKNDDNLDWITEYYRKSDVDRELLKLRKKLKDAIGLKDDCINMEYNVKVKTGG